MAARGSIRQRRARRSASGGAAEQGGGGGVEQSRDEEREENGGGAEMGGADPLGWLLEKRRFGIFTVPDSIMFRFALLETA